MALADKWKSQRSCWQQMESERRLQKYVPYSYQCPELKNEDAKHIFTTIYYPPQKKKRKVGVETVFTEKIREELGVAA